MGYEVGITTSAAKDLDRLPADVQARVAAAIDDLADEPRPAGVKKLKGKDKGLYRVRVGEHRVVYGVDDEAKKITVARVQDRKDVYRRRR